MSELSTPVIALIIFSSVISLLALFVSTSSLITRRRRKAAAAAGKTDDGASPWPQPSRERITEELKRRPPGSGPE